MVAAPEPDTDGLPLREWIRVRRYQYILCDLVLRAKTIEANALLSAGLSPRLNIDRSLQRHEALLREDIAGPQPIYLGAISSQPRRGVMAKESSISSMGEVQLEF